MSKNLLNKLFSEEKRKKESHIKSSNDEREWREERPTEREEWMLNLLDFFLFTFQENAQ
jgi:hypothetical protein